MIRLLLTSKAMCHEYQLRANKKSQILITDTGSRAIQAKITLPKKLVRVRAIRAELGCANASRLAAHHIWVSALMNTAGCPRVLSVRINYTAVGFSSSLDGPGLKDWVGLQGLTDLKVYKVGTLETQSGFRGQVDIHWQCSSTTGQLEDVTTRTQTPGEGV